MAADPLVSLVARALRAEVASVEVESVATTPLAEDQRLRWRGPAGEGILRFLRVHERAMTEPMLLPHLSRKGLPVPRVVARGVPPPHAPERRAWVLTEEVAGAPLCDGIDLDLARRAGETLRALQEGTARDEPALRALGVPALAPVRVRDDALAAVGLLAESEADRLRALAAGVDVDALASLGARLAHGAFGCEALRRDGDGVVVLNWTRAHLGCPLMDLAHLARDLRDRDPMLAEAAVRGYGEDASLLPHAERLQALFDVRWIAWEVQEGILARDAAPRLLGAILDRYN